MSNTETNKRKLQEQSNIQDYAENNLKEKFPSVTEFIEGTPFQIVRREPGWFIAIKNRRITEYYENREEAEKLVKEKNWFIILQMIVHVVEETVKL